MKAEFDKDIDSLLRESARRGRAASVEPGAAAGGAVHAAHLDADEQSAYAENALPAAARAHYAAHLADCDDCRRNVTRLALAAGMPAQLEPRATAAEQAVPANVNWRERLGALLAPRAWRYAVPALALLLVSVVTFVVLTRKPREQAADTTIARRNTSEPQRPQAAQPETHHAQQNDNATATTIPAAPGDGGVTVAPNAGASPSNPNVSAAKEEIAANSERAEVAQPVTGVTLNDVASPPPPAPVTGSGAPARTVSELPMATPAPAVDELTITSSQEAKAKSGAPAPQLRKLEQRAGDFENRQYENRQPEKLSGPRRNEQARNTRPADADDSRADRRGGNVGATASAPPAATAAERRSRQPEADRRRDENRQAENLERSEGASAKSVAETRTVAGRKFRRQDNAWVDTAYRAGQSYTVVRRGSEQFRALAADEPELRRIADALGGEVTVVWKGRAYRIR
ncbi:MAG TPA: hypothetical protein VD835_20630 [Pyrinomonadaceae bacterium]|nr:hypothetical protein [Pyrinomonadaceae bacterium]